MCIRDRICLLPDWHDSKGARLERTIAEAVLLEVLHYERVMGWSEVPVTSTAEIAAALRGK